MNHSSESDHHALIDCENFSKKFKRLRVLNLGSAVLDQFIPFEVFEIEYPFAQMHSITATLPLKPSNTRNAIKLHRSITRGYLDDAETHASKLRLHHSPRTTKKLLQLSEKSHFHISLTP